MNKLSKRKLRIAFESTFPSFISKQWALLGELINLVTREITKRHVYSGSFLSRFGIWRRGFLSESYVIYRFQKLKDSQDYLPDYHRYVRSGGINRPFQVILNDKVLFYLILRSYTRDVAPVSGIIKGDRFYSISLSENDHIGYPLDVLSKLKGRFVLKPLYGGGGSGILFYENRDGIHVINQEIASTSHISSYLKSETYIVCPVIPQARYSSNVFSNTTNTIRIVTMWDYSIGRAFIAAAVHRFGTVSSGAVDNWAQGGVCAAIDVETGVLSRAAAYPKAGRVVWHKKHPDSSTIIEGLLVPNWSFISSEIIQLAECISFLPYVGWDIIPTDEGFSIVEGNNRTDVNLLQLHKGLLRDSRIREFYKHHRVIT